MKNRKCTFELKPVSPDCVEKIISELKNSSSYGLDQIETKIIKIISKEIVPSVTHKSTYLYQLEHFLHTGSRQKSFPFIKKRIH